MFQEWSSAVQAMTGIIALILSAITLLQTKRINELVDMVKELQNQTAVMKEQFKLQDYMSLFEKSPIFKPFEFVPLAKETSKPLLVIANFGKKAFDVRVANTTPEFVYIAQYKYGDIERDRTIRIFLDLKDITREDYEKMSCPVEFDIFFETIDNVPVKQHVRRDLTSRVGFTVSKIEIANPSNINN